MDFLKIIIEFLITFIALYLLYYFVVIRKCKNNKDYVPVEVNIILMKYKIDLKKIDLYSMIKVVSLVSTLILSFIVTIVIRLFNNTIISLILGTIFSVLLSIICYGFIGKYYQKKSNIVVKK